MASIKYNIETVEEIEESTLIVFSVSKSELINNDFRRIKKVIELFNKSGKNGKEKLSIVFDGYQDDKREIYEIKEIRRYVNVIYEICRHIFYFLSNFDNNRSIIFACLNNIRCLKFQGRKDVLLEILYKDDIKQETITAMLSWGMVIDDYENCQRIISTFI